MKKPKKVKKLNNRRKYMKRKTEILTKAGVLLIAAAMLLSALPAVMANTGTSPVQDEETFGVFDTIQPIGSTGRVPFLTGDKIPYNQEGTLSSGGFGSTDWIRYHSGYTNNGLGLTNGGLLVMAIGLTDVELDGFRGDDITDIHFACGADEFGADPGTEYDVWIQESLPADPWGLSFIASGISTADVWQEISDVDYTIPSSGDVYVGVNYVQLAGTYPCGIDDTITTPDRGGFITYDGLGDWQTLGAIGFPGVWGIDVGVGEGGEVEGDCLPDQCDFAISWGPDGAFPDMYNGKINSLPSIINVSIANLGEIGIGEVKLLADVYEKVCGPTTVLYDDQTYCLQTWEDQIDDVWTIIDDGDDDTWVLQGGADNRWFTNDQAWRSTPGSDRSYGGDAGDTYLGLCPTCDGPDALIWNPVGSQNVISGAAAATFTFDHWMQGEYTTDANGNVIPVDYGVLSYSLDGGSTWVDIPMSDFVAFDNDWESVTLKFINTAVHNDTDEDWKHPYYEVCDNVAPEEGEIVFYEEFPDVAELAIAFNFFKDPCLQFEGWYIDNVKLTRTEGYNLELVHQTHEILELDPCEGEPEWQWFEFPLMFDPQPDTWYEIHICGQVFEPAGCEIDITNNCVFSQFYVTDIHDVMCKDLELLTPEVISPGDSATVEMTVKNIGTFTETNIPVELRVAKAVVDSRIDDDFETDPSGRWNFYYFIGFLPENFFRWTKGDPSIDNIYDVDEAQARSRLPGSESLIFAEEGVLPYLVDGASGLITDGAIHDLDEVIEAHLSFYTKWSLGIGWDTYWDEPFPGTETASAAVWVSPTEGPDSGFWWVVDFGAWQHNGVYQNDWLRVDIDMKAIAEDFMYGDGIVPPIEFGFGALTHEPYTGSQANPSNPIPWSGWMLDNIKFDVVDCGGSGDLVAQTTITDALLPGEETTVQLTWPDAEFCTHCLIAQTRLDTDVNPENDACSVIQKVVDVMDHEFDFESVDLTTEGDCLWHICDTRPGCGGGHRYAWAGIEEETWGHYVNNMDDLLVSPDLSALNLAQYDSLGMALNFSHWYEFKDTGDWGEILVRARGSDPWSSIKKFTGASDGFITDQVWIKPEYVTNNTQVAFRMRSNSEGISEGWFIDEVKFMEVIGTGTFSGTFADHWISYNDGWLDNALAWNDGSPWVAAMELSDPELAGFRDFDLTEVNLCTGSDEYGYYVANYDIYYATGALPDSTAFGSPIASGVSSGAGWDLIAVDPQSIPASGSAFIIVSWSNYGSNWPAGFDEDNTDPRGGHLLYVGTTDDWRTLGDLGYPGVWGIDAGLTEAVDIVTGDVIFSDDFHRSNIAPWTCVSMVGGNFWRHSSNVADLPNAGDFTGVGFEVCKDYLGTGTGINTATYTKIDLTGDLEYIEFDCMMDYDFAQESAFIEISANWNPETMPMEDALWVTFWQRTPGDLNPANTGGWLALSDIVDDDRFVLNQFIGQEIYIRFRLTTPGEGAPVGDGWAIDDLSYVYKGSFEEEFIDDQPPVTSIFVDGDGVVTLSAIDMPAVKNSGVKATYYQLDGGEAQMYTQPFQLPEGETTITYWSEDNAGNVETKKTVTRVIDTTPPTVEFISPEEGKIYLFGSPLMNRILGTKALCIGSVPIEVNADDGDGSGIRQVNFMFDNDDTGFADSPPYKYTYRGMHFGALTITAVAIDNVGLYSSPVSMEVNVYSLGLL